MKRREVLALSVLGAAAAIAPSRPSLSRNDRITNKTGAIASLRIYPAIGICRVGGSHKWFLSPEIPGLAPEDPDNYKDGDSLIKKQVQRFRIYAFDQENRVIGEITSDDADISWNARLANTKAAWYEFFNPLDNGELAPPMDGGRRNPQIKSPQERKNQLIVDSGIISITGSNTNRNGGLSQYQCGGKFMNQTNVELGELRTDAKGRLLVFPGPGKSSSPTGHKITSYADNPEWIDDWCDGPIKALVKLKGDSEVIEAESAWVAAVGPNYAPEITPLVTMYDVIEHVNYTQSWSSKNKLVSFRQDIYPILRRLDLMRWVSEAALLRSGWADLGPLHKESYILKLSDNSPKHFKERNSILEKIRPPRDYIQNAKEDSKNDLMVPMMAGDGINYEDSPLHMFRLTNTQYENLKRWAKGEFIADFIDQQSETIQRFEDIPLSQQPNALTRSALESCSGGAFHPGVELTYNLRHPTLFSKYYDNNKEAFRIAIGDRKSLYQDLGSKLTASDFVMTEKMTNSPIGKQMAGDLTRWMGIPWQCDVFSCQDVPQERDFPTATWWPAQIPINVLPEEFYQQAIDESLSEQERILFANQRKRWTRQVAGIGYHSNQSYWDGIENMISLWQTMGFVIRRGEKSTDIDNGSFLNDEFFVETGRGLIDLPSPFDQRRSET